MDRKNILAILAAIIFAAFLFSGYSLSSEATSGVMAVATSIPTATEPPPETPLSQHRCGDRVCDGPENPRNCPQDCPPAMFPPPFKGKCGDGLCDEFEQQNPDLCPQDCAPTSTMEGEPTASPTPVPSPTPTMEREPTASPTPVPSPTPTMKGEPTASLTPSLTPTMERKPTPTYTPAPEAEPSRLVINEVQFKPLSGESQWVELLNSGQASLDLAGYQLADGDDHIYTFPDDLPSVPAGGIVLLRFDGQGSSADETDFSDNVAVLHTSPELVDILDEADQLGLYGGEERSAETMVDFVAWGGAPGEKAADAAAAGLWHPERWVETEEGFGVISGEAVPGQSLGLYPGLPAHGLHSWAIYHEGETSPGEANWVPAPGGMALPPDGAVVGAQTFYLAWTWAGEEVESFKLQLDDSPGFDSPMLDLTVENPTYVPEEPLPAGQYYWRVKAVDAEGRESPWSLSRGGEIVSLPEVPQSSSLLTRADQWGGMLQMASFSPSALSDVGLWVTLPVPALSQRKDTEMLCLEGCPEESGSEPWDGPHEALMPMAHSKHSSHYCTRASIAMIASYFGGDLSQDRISYVAFGGGDPEGDLGHGLGVDISELAPLLSWALNANVGIHGKPPFEQIEGWIDGGRPLMFTVPGHAMVIAGYGIYEGEPWLVINDPWLGRALIYRYEDINLEYLWVPPASAKARSDEPEIEQDSDGDGICDFDELYRFSTDRENTDTDDDDVDDKEDLREYVFDDDGSWFPLDADWDGDGERKEVDCDNDNDCLSDGMEDENGNGKQDWDETSNFEVDECPIGAGVTWQGTEHTTLVTETAGDEDCGSPYITTVYWDGSFEFTVDDELNISGSGTMIWRETMEWPRCSCEVVMISPPEMEYELKGRVECGHVWLARTFTTPCQTVNACGQLSECVALSRWGETWYSDVDLAPYAEHDAELGVALKLRLIEESPGRYILSCEDTRVVWSISVVSFEFEASPSGP